MNVLLKMRLLTALCFALACTSAIAAQTLSVDYAANVSDLFEDHTAFEGVLPADEVVRWKFVPAPGESAGLLVFISPDSSGLPQDDWHEVLNARNLHWIAAEDFGNDKATAQRILAALMGLRLVERKFDLDRKRIYIGGMSGGGRAASAAISTFPQLFSGALYIVGADPWPQDASSRLPHIRAKRYVFLTGRGDFNRAEIRKIHRQYIAAGVTNAWLLDLPRFGHQYPNASQFDKALAFLDGDPQ